MLVSPYLWKLPFEYAAWLWARPLTVIDCQGSEGVDPYNILQINNPYIIPFLHTPIVVPIFTAPLPLK